MIPTLPPCQGPAEGLGPALYWPGYCPCCSAHCPACRAVTVGGAGGHRAGPGPAEAQLPSGIRHPEELSLLRAPEKKEKKKKEKEPEEEVYDLTKVVLAGGEHRLGRLVGGAQGPSPGSLGLEARPG